MSLSRMFRKQGKTAEAHKLLEETYGWFKEGFDTPDLKEAKALLEELNKRDSERLRATRKEALAAHQMGPSDSRKHSLSVPSAFYHLKMGFEPFSFKSPGSPIPLS